MKAFSEKGDLILRTLTTGSPLSWDLFTKLTSIKKDDAVLIYLKLFKAFITCTDAEIAITDKGRDFITSTSFVEQRNKQQEA